MRRIILALAAVAIGTAGGALAQRKFGPEWTRVKTPHGDMLSRKVTAEVTHWPGGNVSGYRLPLEKGEIGVHQDDEHLHTSVQLPNGSELDVRVDAAGKPTEHRVILGDSVYFDLDGNGTIDALYTPRGIGGGARRPYIVLEGRHIEVEDHKNAFDGRNKRGVGNDPFAYLFTGGRWQRQ